MNKIIALICCLIFSKAVLAQKDSLAFDDRGKYIYYRIVAMPGLSSDTLYKRSLRVCKKESSGKDFKIISSDDAGKVIACSGYFITYKPSLAKHPDGQVAFTLRLEIKDFKYRYWLTDFVYTPYFRDRYNSYVPEKGIEIPLEGKSKKITEKEMVSYLDQSATFARLFGGKLKEKITILPGQKIKADTTRRVHIDKNF